MPYHAQPRLDGTVEPLRVFVSLWLDAGAVERLSIVLTRPLDLERLSEERYSNLTGPEALDVLAATLDLAGADWETR